jgi:hypothetical protein
MAEGSHAKTRSRERVGINKGVLECSGLTELGMGRERVDGKIQSGVKPPQSKKQGSAISRGDAEVRKGGGRVPQLPKTFCGHEGCPGVLRLDGAWDGNRARRWENPKRCQATAVQETKDPESHAETRRCERVGIEFRRCLRRFVAVRVSWSAPA